MPKNAVGFTLIELLVVITIIVILLALLTPALDKAIYQTELMVCAANMKGVGTAITAYATDQSRYYPQRTIAENRAMNIGGAGRDFRPQIVPYLSLRMLIDPFCKDVDLSIEANDASIYTYSSNWLWFGWHMSTSMRGVKRLGDRLEFIDEAGRNYRFPILMSDGQALQGTNFWSQNSHPDRENRWVNDPQFQVLCPTCGLSYLTYSLFVGTAYNTTGFSMDCNYLFNDLSVTQLEKLIYDPDTLTHDERLVKVYERINNTDANLQNYLPQYGSTP